jgi:glutamate dehydrogenase/leucine dehydrogenase
MSTSLFTPLAAERYTSFVLSHDWRTGDVRLQVAREWDTDLDFSKYQDAFTAEDLLTDNATILNTAQTRDLYIRHGLGDYLEQVIDLVRQGRHNGIEAYFHEAKDIRFMCHQHSRRLGLKNKSHAIMAGGIRRHDPTEDELDVIVDGLNLGRAMSFKNVAADLDFGGCKTTVQMQPLELDDLEAMGFLAFALDRCRTMTGPDMYFPTEMADIINERYSAQFTNGPSSPIGESGKPTAYGVYLALLEAMEFLEGSKSVRGKSAVVMGLGAVGRYLAEHLVEGGAHVTVADLNTSAVDEFIDHHPGADVASIPVGEVMTHHADILLPAAIGGIIDEDVIKDLRYKVVFGPANNQLKASSQAEEERLARLLADRDILFQTEWWHNTAGVMSGAEEYLNGQDASPDTLRERVERTVPRRTRENLAQARELGVTPTENAYRLCSEKIYAPASVFTESVPA